MDVVSSVTSGHHRSWIMDHSVLILKEKKREENEHVTRQSDKESKYKKGRK